ncbi:MAG: four-helix bundle copper-binding protein [Ferruginibacter sp.]
MKQQQYQKCIDACIECATDCNHCAVSCLEEKDVQHLTKCIRLDLECAVICRTSAELMSIGSFYSKQVCKICATICNACADECERHAAMGMEHCKECADACRACAKETMAIYVTLQEQDTDTKPATVRHDECAILSRASAELMSLGSAYSKQVCELTASVCTESAETFENYLNKGMKHSQECALTATEANQHLENQHQEENSKATETNNGQAGQNTEVIQKKKKHSSALMAASMWRSPVGHSLLHVNHDVRGSNELPNTGPFVNYDE